MSSRPGPLHREYARLCGERSNIRSLLPELRWHAREARVVVELGTWVGRSAVAFLAAEPRGFVSVDREFREDVVKRLGDLAEEVGTTFRFLQSDSRKVEIPHCDLLFIDTTHTEAHLYAELMKHRDRVAGKILIHDVITFGRRGMRRGSPEGQVDEMHGPEHYEQRGLMHAIERFLERSPEWRLAGVVESSNGLAILERSTP